MFKASVIGNLGDDAKVMESNGKKFVSFKVAHSESFERADGTKVESTTWISCALNGDGGNLLQYLKKGVKVYVSGRCSLRCFHSPAARQMIAGADISVDSVELCGGSSDIVPRQLVDENGIVHNVSKLYHITMPEGVKSLPLHGIRGGDFIANVNGWVSRVMIQGESDNQED